MENQPLLDRVEKLGEKEKSMISSLLRRKPVIRDLNAEFQERLTFGQRLADRVATFGGSWTFIFLFVAGMVVWMLINAESTEPLDPFPFILLNLILSCLAALQAPIIMMSQNRQAARDRLEARHDYEVNLKAEMEITGLQTEIGGLNTKLDQLSDAQWKELLELQQRQVELLEAIRESLKRN